MYQRTTHAWWWSGCSVDSMGSLMFLKRKRNSSLGCSRGDHVFSNPAFWVQKHGEAGAKAWRNNMSIHYSRNHLTQKHATEMLRNAVKCTLPRCFEISTTHISLSSTRFILQFPQPGTKVWKSHTNANENDRISEISTRLISCFSLNGVT